MYRIESRVRRLNDLGFDVDELDIITDFDGATIRIQPKVVDAGPSLPAAAPADRAGRRGEPGPTAAQRPRLLPCAHRPAGRRRGDRRPPVADRPVRAGRASGPDRPARQARAGRGLPRDARAPLVPQRAGRGRDPDGRCGKRLHQVPCCGGLPDEEIAVPIWSRQGRWPIRFDPSQGFVDDEYEKPYDPWEDEAAEPDEEPAEAYLDIAALRARAKKK